MRPLGKTDHLLFLTVNGRKYTQVYRKIQEATATKIKHIELPAPSKYRRMVRTEASCLLTDQGLQKLARHTYVPEMNIMNSDTSKALTFC